MCQESMLEFYSNSSEEMRIGTIHSDSIEANGACL